METHARWNTCERRWLHVPARRVTYAPWQLVFVVSLGFVLALPACSPPWDSGHHQTPTPTSTPRRQPPQPQVTGPTTQDLINKALQAGTIDRGTALLYRFYALVGDTRLPQQLVGDGGTDEDPYILLDARAQLSSLPPSEQHLLHPFLVRPNHPDSYFSQPPASHAALASSAAPETVDRLTTRWFAARADVTTTIDCPRGWHGEKSAAHTFTVWANCGFGQAAAEAAQRDDLAVVPLLDAIWQDETKLMTPLVPRPDTPRPATDDGNDDSSLDVYLVDLQPVYRAGRPRTTRAGAATADTCDGRQCSTFILLSRTGMNSFLPTVLVHEFFHALQNAANTFVGCPDDQLACSESGHKFWFYEASATWAEFYFAPPSKRDDIDGAYDQFKHFQQQPTRRALTDTDAQNEYEAWAWPLYMQQHAKPASVAAAWQALVGKSSMQEAMEALNGVVSFEDEFHNFAVENINMTLDDALDPLYKNLASAFPTTVPQDIEGDAKPLKVQAGGSTLAYSEAPPIIHLTASYLHYKVADERIHQVVFDFSTLVAYRDLDIDAVFKIKDKPWQQLGLTGHSQMRFCLDNKDFNLDEIYLVLSDHSLVSNALNNGPLEVRTYPNSCQGWSGIITRTETGSYSQRVHNDGIPAPDGSTTTGSATANYTATLTMHTVTDSLDLNDLQMVGRVTVNWSQSSEDTRTPSKNHPGTCGIIHTTYTEAVHAGGAIPRTSFSLGVNTFGDYSFVDPGYRGKYAQYFLYYAHLETHADNATCSGDLDTSGPFLYVSQTPATDGTSTMSGHFDPARDKTVAGQSRYKSGLDVSPGIQVDDAVMHTTIKVTWSFSRVGATQASQNWPSMHLPVHGVDHTGAWVPRRQML